MLPVDPVTGAISPTPFDIDDPNSKLGWNLGAYIQDEWKLTNELTLTAGLRFDQLYQFVDANQLSPRLALVYKPFPGTTFHAGYARYFTPPYQAQAVSSNIALFTNTTNAPEVQLASPVLPERSNYYDVGVDQIRAARPAGGLDAYYKDAVDMIDDGQFGQAVVLTQFNYARGYSEGGEVKLKYSNGNFRAYANLAFNITRAIDVISNQYLFDQATYEYLLTNWHYTDDMQMWTASAGMSYRWNGTLFSTTDLRQRPARRRPVRRSCTQFAQQPALCRGQFRRLARRQVVAGVKAGTLRFDIVNLFDNPYVLRDGSGIGVFAPQYGARRGFYAGISQKL